MKILLIIWSVITAADIVISFFAMHSGRKDRESKDRLIEALFVNREAQQDQIKELRRKSAALEHLLDLCIKQGEKKEKEERHDRPEDAGN